MAGGTRRGYPQARLVLHSASFHSANLSQVLGIKGAKNTHLNLIIIYQCMSNSLLTKLLGRMELSPVSSSQCSNEPVTMEMSLLPSPASGKRDAQVQHQGSWLFPTASGTPADSNPNPKAGLEKLLLAPGCWHGCRARWPGAHCAPQSQLKLADGYSWGPTAPAALCVRLFLKGCWLLLGFLSQGAPGTGSVFVQPHAVSDGRAGMEKHPWV